MKYVHDISGKDIFAEVARKAIQDEYGKDINETYLKKVDLTFQYNDDEEIVGINNSAIAAGQGSIKLVGDDGIYVRNDLTGKIIGISAQYATPSDVAKKQDKLSEDQLIDIDSIPFKLDKSEFETVSGTFATKDYVAEKIADIGSPLVIRGSKTCAEIEALTGMKVGDVYCVKDSGTIHGMVVMVRDEVAWTSDNEWIVVGREIAVDLSDYYKKSETSGASQLDAAFANVDVKFEDYYTTTETSGKDQISEALASKVDSTAMTAYYTKLETSGSQELEDKFGTKVDTTAMTAYVDKQYLANNYYDKTETSSKTEIANALSGKVDNEELELYYTMAETSGANQLSAAFNEKLDVTAFNLSSTAWNDTTDVVRENSAAWAEGGAGDPAVNELVHSNSAMWNEVEDKLYTTAFSTISGTFATDEDLESKADVSAINDLKDKLDTIEEGAQKNVQSNWTETNTASDAYIKNKPDIYTKSEVDTLLNGKIVVVEQLPAIGESSKIYYVGPNSSVSGDDKYDEYLWYENDWLHVGEHSIDLSDYATYEYVDALTDGKQDTLSWSYDGTKLSAINGSAIKDTTYTAGENIDITNNVISGKDWSNEISAAVADKADNKDVEDLAEEMADGFAGLSDDIAEKTDISAFEDLSGKVDGIKGTILTGDANIRATSAEEGNNIKWTLELTAQPVVTDTTLNGYSGVVATKDSVVSSQWNVGLAQGYVDSITSISGNSGHWNEAYEYATNASAIGVITKSDVDEIWAIVTGERV
jgi:hypothetical protein